MILTDVTKMSLWELASELRQLLIRNQALLTKSERIRTLDIVLELEQRGIREDEQKSAARSGETNRSSASGNSDKGIRG